MSAQRADFGRILAWIVAVHGLSATGCKMWKEVPQAQSGVDRISSSFMKRARPDKVLKNLEWAQARFDVDRESVVVYRPEYPVIDWDWILDHADRYDVPRETLEPWDAQYHTYRMYNDRYEIRVRTRTGAIRIAQASVTRGGDLGPAVVTESASDEQLVAKAEEILNRLDLFPSGKHMARVSRGERYTSVDFVRILDGLPTYPPGNYCLVTFQGGSFLWAKLLWPKVKPWKKFPIRPPSVALQDFINGKGWFNLPPSTKGAIDTVELAYCPHGGHNETFLPCYNIDGRGDDRNLGGYVDALPEDYLKKWP